MTSFQCFMIHKSMLAFAVPKNRFFLLQNCTICSAIASGCPSGARVRFSCVSRHDHTTECRHESCKSHTTKWWWWEFSSGRENPMVVGTHDARLGSSRSMKVGRVRFRVSVRVPPSVGYPCVGVCSRGFHCATSASGHARRASLLRLGCIGARGLDSRKTVRHYQKTRERFSVRL